MILWLFKKPIMFLLFLGAASAGGYYYLQKYQPGKILGVAAAAQNLMNNTFPQANQWLAKLPFSPQLPIAPTGDQPLIAAPEIGATLGQTSGQLETLGEKSLEVKDQLVNFVAEIKESTQSTPLHERALEYGQYLYCQQIIKEYEK